MNETTFLYEKVKQQLLDDIGTMKKGDALPNRIMLSNKYQVARTTLERAISELEAEGYLTSRRGSGTYVTDRRPVPHGAGLLTVDDIPQNKDGDLWALLLSNILYDIYPHILRGVEDYANKIKKNLIICNTDNSGLKEDTYVRDLLKRNVSGFIVIPAIDGIYQATTFNAIMQYDFPVVTCVRPIPGFDFPGILLNNFEIGYLATTHLMEKGCRHVAYVSQKRYASTFERYQGYRTAIAHGGAKSQPDLSIFETDIDTAETGYEVTKQLLSEHPEVDGVFASNDRVAVGVYRAAQEMGRTVGEDIKVVGCDNTDICQNLPVKLSSVGFDAYAMGQRAAQYMHQLCSEGSSASVPTTIIPVELIERDSSK